jgi:hypothetical protein
VNVSRRLVVVTFARRPPMRAVPALASADAVRVLVTDVEDAAIALLADGTATAGRLHPSVLVAPSCAGQGAILGDDDRPSVAEPIACDLSTFSIRASIDVADSIAASP